MLFMDFNKQTDPSRGNATTQICNPRKICRQFLQSLRERAAQPEQR